MVNGRQIAAARALLGISQAELAEVSKVAKRTVAHFEGGSRVLQERTVKALVDAMNEMGIEFVMEDDVGVGIRISKAKALELATASAKPE